MNELLLLLAFQLQATNYPMLVTDQSTHRVMIVQAPSGDIIKEWCASDIPEQHRKWFRNPSEVKFSRSGKYLLTCASGGGAAIIRIRDEKTLWYDSVGGNPHSLDIGPGNILVVASSTGNYTTLFQYDLNSTKRYEPNRPRRKIDFSDGHAVNFYDGYFYVAGANQIKAYEVRQGKRKKNLPDLVAVESYTIPGIGAHDMIYGAREKVFYLTTVDTLLEFHATDGSFHPVPGKISRNIKSYSEGANKDLPSTVTVPKEQWWTDEVTDLQGKTILKIPGARIYKARWLIGYINTYKEYDKNGKLIRDVAW